MAPCPAGARGCVRPQPAPLPSAARRGPQRESPLSQPPTRWASRAPLRSPRSSSPPSAWPLSGSPGPPPRVRCRPGVCGTAPWATNLCCLPGNAARAT
eukprot:3931574-Rhodomonas_salina.1